MKASKPKEKSSIGYVRMNLKVIQMVRDNKKKTGVPIGYFFEQAAIEKLKKAK